MPFGLRVDYWVGPKSKVKPSLRFEPSSNPGVFLGFAIQSNFVWRKEFLVLPLKDVMESEFNAEIQPIRVNQISVPEIGLHFPRKGRYNMIREGLFPGSRISGNPPRVEDEQAPSSKHTRPCATRGWTTHGGVWLRTIGSPGRT